MWPFWASHCRRLGHPMVLIGHAGQLYSWDVAIYPVRCKYLSNRDENRSSVLDCSVPWRAGERAKGGGGFAADGLSITRASEGRSGQSIGARAGKRGRRKLARGGKCCGMGERLGALQRLLEMIQWLTYRDARMVVWRVPDGDETPTIYRPSTALPAYESDQWTRADESTVQINALRAELMKQATG